MSSLPSGGGGGGTTSSTNLNLNPSDIRIYYSSKQVGDTLYLGGYRTNQELSDNYLHNFFPRTTEAEEVSGITKHRCGYIFNANPHIYMKNPILYIVQDTSSPNDYVMVGWGTSEIGTGLVGTGDYSVEQELDDEHSVPNGVYFYDGNVKSEGAILGQDIPPLKGKAFWIEYTSEFDAKDFPRNTFVLRCDTDNLPHNVTSDNAGGGGLNRATISFPVISECSSTAAFTKMINYIIAQSPDFIVTTGNNNIDANSTFFLSALQSYLNRLIIGFGGRDVVNTTVSNAYVNAISSYNFVTNVSRKYYSKSYGNVHVLVMDTSGDAPYTNPSSQYTFVLNDLKAAFADPNIDWIFVITNKAMYSSQTTSAIRLLYPDLRDTYHQMFTDYGVIAVIQGTFHFYERTKVLGYNADNPSVPDSFAYNGPTNYTIRGKKSFMGGSLFYTVGSGGGPYDIISPTAQYSQFTDANDTGYLMIKVDNTGSDKKLIIRYYASSRQTNVFVDEVIITRLD